MDSGPANVICARKNVRVYGIENHFEFIAGDFSTDTHNLKKLDEIVSSPPANLCEIKLGESIKLTNKVAPKVLLKWPKNQDKSDVNKKIVVNTLREYRSLQ